MNRRIILAMLAVIPAFTFAQSKATEYLNIPGPISFNNQSYLLSWSSHPQPTYFKQEYLVKGENSEKYKSMVMVEVATGDFKLKDIVASKISELQQMKKTNPLVNYESFENKQTGEIMLDFLMSANDAKGQTSIIERNVYKYKLYIDKKGNKGVILFAVSERGYAPNVDAFLINLKANKSKLQNAVSKFVLPDASIKM